MNGNPRHHFSKKVITWNQLFVLCKYRKLNRFCPLLQCDDKSCRRDEFTKRKCPVFNYKLQPLVMFNFKKRSESYNEERSVKQVGSVEKRFVED